MSTVTTDLSAVELDDEGFFRDPARWTIAMVPELARRAEIPELTDEHWYVIQFVRQRYEDSGAGPNVRALSKSSGVPVRRLYELFPHGPAKTAARIAGIPKPQGCI